jgi:hypothetical protein
VLPLTNQEYSQFSRFLFLFFHFLNAFSELITFFVSPETIILIASDFVNKNKETILYLGYPA